MLAARQHGVVASPPSSRRSASRQACRPRRKRGACTAPSRRLRRRAPGLGQRAPDGRRPRRRARRGAEPRVGRGAVGTTRTSAARIDVTVPRAGRASAPASASTARPTFEPTRSPRTGDPRHHPRPHDPRPRRHPRPSRPRARPRSQRDPRAHRLPLPRRPGPSPHPATAEPTSSWPRCKPRRGHHPHPERPRGPLALCDDHGLPSPANTTVQGKEVDFLFEPAASSSRPTPGATTRPAAPSRTTAPRRHHHGRRLPHPPLHRPPPHERPARRRRRHRGDAGQPRRQT